MPGNDGSSVYRLLRFIFFINQEKLHNPSSYHFNDVIKLVSRMTKSVKNVLFNGTRPISRIFARLSFQRPEEAVNSGHRCWCYCVAIVEGNLKVFHSYNFLACTRGSDGTGISHTVRCVFYINSFIYGQLNLKRYRRHNSLDSV